MNRLEHLLVILMEECAEVAQCASKSLRFGLTDSQPGTRKDNATRLTGELADLCGVVNMLTKEGFIKFPDPWDMKKKEEKVEKWLLYSSEQGLLTEGQIPHIPDFQI